MLKGETYFLRAYMYSELVRGFGGVPIVDKVYTIEEASSLSLPRSSVKECLEFILSDLDKAIELLPEKYHRQTLAGQLEGLQLP